MNEIFTQENQNVSAEKESHENIESDFYESKLYQMYNMDLDDTNEKL